MRLGADPAALEEAAAALLAAGGHLDVIAATVGASVRSAAWTGPDAAEFRAAWSGRHRPALVRAAARCTAAARTLRRHAEEQRRASGSGPVPAAGAPSAGAGPGAAGRADLPEPAAVVDVYGVALDGAIGPVAGVAGATLTVEHLADGRLRVHQTERTGAGAGVGSGRSAALVRDGVPGPATGTSAGGALRLDGSTTRTWTIEASALPGLLAGLALDASPLTWPARAAGDAARALDEAAAWLGVDLPLDRVSVPSPVPTPERVEHLAGVALAGSATLGAGRSTALGSSTAALSVGTADGPDGRRWIAEWTDSGATSMTAPLARALGVDAALPADAALSARAEVPAAGTSGPGLVTLTAVRDREVVTVRVVVERDAADALHGVLEAAALAGQRGDPLDVAGAVAGLSLDGAAIAVDVTGATVDDSRISVPVAAGAVAVAPTAGHVRLIRR